MKFRKIEMIDYEDMAKLVDYDAVAQFRARALNPNILISRARLKILIFISRTAKRRINL